MGTTLYLATDPPLKGVELNHDRVFLADLVGEQRLLDELSAKHGVRSLAEFQSYDASMFADFVGEEKTKTWAKESPVEWFDPADALPTLRVLRDHYRTARFIQERGRKPAGKSTWEPVDRTDDLLSEIDDLESVLTKTAEAGARFRIYIGE
jgi:hypothetical protein